MTPGDVLRLHPELSEEEAIEITEVVNKYLKQMLVVKAAEFACSPEGRKPKSGAMGRLNRAIEAYTE
jgi:hypothetical protein